jgi:uncharacterized damage-inducible protein DinB
MTQDLAEHFRHMARNNAWANRRLAKACAGLSAADFRAPRTGFFPSLSQTLNHILICDLYYVASLEGRSDARTAFDDEEPFPDPAAYAAAQQAVDRRLVAYCDGLTPARLGDPVNLDRGADGIRQDRAADILAHLFQHQIHHRGQAHAMLSATAVKPPQLDEYFLREDWARRDAELAEIGIS